MMRRRQGCWEALVHPCFVLALAVLVANDHWLKASGFAPGWLTGKLSDFAGLVVAPVLAFALLPIRLGRLRWGAFLLPVVVFVGINVSASAATRWDAWMGLTGVSWRTACDPSDLLALLVLPLSIWLAGRKVRPEATTVRRSVGPVELVLALTAAFACMATSGPGGPNTRVMLQNQTRVVVPVRARWLEGEFDCAALTRYHELFGDDRYGKWHRFELDPLEAVALDRYLRYEDSECGAIELEIEALPRLRVVYDGQPVFFEYQILKHPDQVVNLEGIGSVVDYSGGSALDLSEVGEVATPQNCSSPESVLLSWSTSDFFGSGGHTLSEIETSDGCSTLGFEDGLSLELCIPETLFPFAVGDSLLVEPGERLALADLAMTTRLSVYDAGLPEGFSFEADDCDPVPSVCGGLLLPGHLTRPGGVLVWPGESVSISSAGATSASLFLGRAEQLVFADDACAGARTELGVRASYVVTEVLE